MKHHHLPHHDTVAALPLSTQLEMLGAKELNVWYPAYTALLERGGAATTTALQGLTHHNPRVRWQALQLLDHLADEACIPAMLSLLDDPVPRVRRMALHALACQRCKPSPLQTNLLERLLWFALHDPSIAMRAEASFGLAQRDLPKDVCAELVAARDALEQRQDLNKPERVWLRNLRLAVKNSAQKAG